MRLLVSGNTAKLRELLEANREYLGRLVVPSCGNRTSILGTDDLPWAADNGAFSDFDPDRFRAFLRRIARAPTPGLFLAVPDVVCDAAATLVRFREWETECRASGLPLALVVQNGLTPAAVPWGDIGALFVGGDDRWKESRAAYLLVAEAKDRGLYARMGRVNSRRRMRIARAWGCDSCDGTGMSRFGDIHLGRMLRWRREIEGLVREPTLFGGEG